MVGANMETASACGGASPSSTPRPPTGAIVNTALLDHCSSGRRVGSAGDELIAHGQRRCPRRLGRAAERALLRHCGARLRAQTGTAPPGWLSPWIAESAVTPDLLVEEGYRYTLNWCHDDQPIRLATRSGESLWSFRTRRN
jgi:peptidoglycan/xylan/chitin deacetylase (PgdA/CDA1 family)